MKLTGCDKQFSQSAGGALSSFSGRYNIQTLISIYLHTYLTLVSPLVWFMVAKCVASITLYRAMRCFSRSTQVCTDFRITWWPGMGISFGSKTCVYGDILEQNNKHGNYKTYEKHISMGLPTA